MMVEMIAIQYLGEIDGVLLEFEMASRCQIMRLIDQARRQQRLPRITPFLQNALFKIDNSGFKVLSDDGEQDVLLRLPLQQVSNIAYILEDQQHIIAIKYGEVQQRGMGAEADEELMCRLVLLLCPTQSAAEHLCTSADGMFEEAHNQHKQQSFLQAFPLPQYEYEESEPVNNSYSFLSSSCSDLHKQDNDNTIQVQRPDTDDDDNDGGDDGNNGDGDNGDGDDVSNNEKTLIIKYMDKLYSVLTESELVEFAGLVQAWQTDMSFETFLDQLTILYGPTHPHLLSEMRPFIPPKDLHTYEQFMQQLTP